MPKAYCPNCDAVVIKDNPRVGAMVTCRECSTELEIISTNPFEVDFPLDYDEDWDEDVEWEEEDEEQY
jgi:alpha-aminoadipate carrier protein LysW